MDKDTQQILTDGDMASRLVASESWQWAKDRWQAIVTATTSLETIDLNLPDEEYKAEAKTRRKALALMNTWIGDVESMAAQHAPNIEALKDKTEDKLTTYLDGEVQNND